MRLHPMLEEFRRAIIVTVDTDAHGITSREGYVEAVQEADAIALKAQRALIAEGVRRAAWRELAVTRQLVGTIAASDSGAWHETHARLLCEFADRIESGEENVE